MKIQVNKNSGYDFNILISAALINLWATSARDEFEDFIIYHHFDSNTGVDAESIYGYALDSIMYNFIKEQFRENVKLIDSSL